MKNPTPKLQEIVSTVFELGKSKPFLLNPGRYTLDPVEFSAMVFLGSLTPHAKIDIVPVGKADYIITMNDQGFLNFYQVVEYLETKDLIIFDGKEHKVHIHYIMSQAEINYMKGWVGCLANK